MPMQPRPIAETHGPPRPSFLCFIIRRLQKETKVTKFGQIIIFLEELPLTLILSPQTGRGDRRARDWLPSPEIARDSICLSLSQRERTEVRDSLFSGFIYFVIFCRNY